MHVRLLPVSALSFLFSSLAWADGPFRLTMLDVGTVIWQTEDPQARAALGHIELTSDDGIWYTVKQGDRVEVYATKDQPVSRLRRPSDARRSVSQVSFTWVPESEPSALSPVLLGW